MNKIMRGGFFLLLLAGLAACKSETTIYDDNYHSHDYYEETEYEYVSVSNYSEPELEALYLIDSMGTNSEYSPNTALMLDAYIDDGLFEVSWEANSWDDYWVEFYISDNPSLDNAAYIGSQMCGIGLACEEDGLQFCQYHPDFSIECDTGENHLAYIDHLIYAIPQTLYFIVQVCDLNFEYCEYQFEPVMMY